MGCWVKWANRKTSKAKWQNQMNHRLHFASLRLVILLQKKKKKSKCEPYPFVTMGTSKERKMEGHHHEENNYTALVWVIFPLTSSSPNGYTSEGQQPFPPLNHGLMWPWFVFLITNSIMWDVRNICAFSLV